MKAWLDVAPWRLVALVIVAAVLFAAGWQVNGWRKDAVIAQMLADLADERGRQASAQVKAVDDARIEEQRRTAAQTEIANDAFQQASEARDHARAADTARRELLARVTALANSVRRPGDPGSAVPGAATRNPVLLLADVLGRADKRAGELAAYADAARIAGQACERSYDALSHHTGPWRPSNERVSN